MYPNAKIYYDGSHYIAIPHTKRPGKKRHKDKDEEFVVESNPTNRDVSYPIKQGCFIEALCGDLKETADSSVSVRSLKESVDGMIPVPQPEVLPFDVPEQDPPKTVTRKSEFNRLYDESKGMSKDERMEFITEKLKPFFSGKEQDSTEYVQLQLENKKRAIQARRLRFIRKAYMNDFNYFATFTYCDDKHTDESFRKKLSNTLRHLVTRNLWKYMGVWERAPKTERLHFHGLVDVPKGQLVGEFNEVRDYDTNAHKMRTTYQNSYFLNCFGRNDFELIGKDSHQEYAKAIAYILKYIEKTGEKIVYSRGLPMYLISDIEDCDVATRFGLEEKKLLLFDDFNCWDNGEWIGVISKEIKALMPKTN